MGNVVFIFIRWSHHYLSFYTTQYSPPNITSYPASSFPFLHLLPMDSGINNTLNALILIYQQQIISSTSTIPFSDDASFN